MFSYLIQDTGGQGPSFLKCKLPNILSIDGIKSY